MRLPNSPGKGGLSKPGSSRPSLPPLFFFSSRRRHTRLQGDWSSDVCSSDLVRAGFGIHNDLQDNLANRLNANPPFSGRLTFMNTPLLSIIPVSAESAPPPACKFVGQTTPPCSVYAPGGIDPDLHTPTLQQWSLTVEHQLAQDLVAEAEYVGSQSYHVSTTMDVNTIQPLTCDNPAGCLAGGIL